MALLDRLAQAQQIIGGYQNQLNYAREYQEQRRLAERNYRDKMRFAEAAEGRAQSAEERAAQLFPTQKAIAEFNLAGGALGIQEIIARLAAAGEQEVASNDLERVQRQIIQLQRIATQNPSAVTAGMFNAVEESTYQLIEKYPPLAASIAPLYTSMVDAANLAIKEGRPTQLTKKGAIQTYKQKKTTVGRETGKVGSYGYMLPTGPNLRAGIPSRGLTGADFVSGSEFESGLRETRMDPSYEQAERTMESFPNFLSLIGSPYTRALMDNIPNE